MESGRGVDGPLALVLGQDALALGLLESAQYLVSTKHEAGVGIRP